MSVTWPAAAAAASHLSSSGAPSQSPGRQRPAAPVVLPPLPFDVRLIPEYDGSTDVVEWFGRTEMLCRLRGVPVESVLPLRLSGGAFAVWSQLPAHSQSSLVAVRGALYAAFALDQHAAYEAFSARRLRPGESADVFLADLRRLAALFGGLPERALTCAFVAGLPDDVRQTIRAGSKAEGLDLTTIVWRPRQVRVTTISGGQLECCGVGAVVVEAPTGHRGTLETVVVEKRPLGVDMVLGIAGVSALGGVTVLSPSEVRFCGAVCSEPLGVDAPDFRVCFDSAERRWTVAWKWRDGEGPECLTNTVAQYTVPSAARREYDAELDAWIAQGWLVPYDEDRHGAAKGLVPLMAVQQSNKAKVRPVMDYRELNGFVSAHTADADVCADQLRKWRRHGANVAVIDLKRAYLQVHVEERLWPYQTVMVRGQRFCLTRLGFGLNTAPQIMKAVVRSVLEQDPDVQRAVLPYVDDLLVNEDVLSADSVVAHFEKFGLNCKPPERAASGARLLGLRVQAEGGKLQWTRDNAVGAPPAPVTRRAVFSWCGRLVAHLPVCGWLRPAVAWLKRRVNQMTRAWDDVTDDAALRAQLDYVAGRLNGDDPARGTCAAVVSEPPPLAGAAAGRADGGTADELRAAVCQSHDRAGHPGVRRTLYFARRDVSRDVTRAMARAVVENCDACRSIDPAPVRWRHGSLGVSVPWQRISIDVTHHRGQNYLTVIDCGPSRFCVWRSLRRANAIEIVGHLEQLFLERGAPEEILTDNDTVFRGRHMAAAAI
ncbi:hypothetical protein FJT64_015207 [Amphibalanus amphitrite]|uniref:Integrase catalytic domain-containing protein n=1 Tax=Amphibalanus amphitrite TaxID=1232801 RepID=A0A6A4X4X8_AMPAM|nr:hypothetical protein FJT64_015207 [Amphibalanus amphitrite]